MAKNQTLELSIKIAGQVDKSLMAAIRTAQNSVSSFSTSVSKMGTAGLASMGALAAGSVAGIVSCTKAASGWESSMADVAKVVDGLRDKNGQLTQSYRDMSASLLDLSTELPYTAEELAQIAAAGGQSGIEQENLIGFTRNAAQMGIAFDVDASQAGQWLANWQQAFGLTQQESMTLANQMNHLSNNTNATAAELAEVIDRIGSVGALTGVETGALLAMSDVMLATGMEAETTATSMRNMMLYLTAGASATKSQAAVFQRLGYTAQGFAKMMQEDASGAITEFLGKIQQLPKELQMSTLTDMFGMRSVEGITKLAGNLEQMQMLLQWMDDPNLYDASVAKETVIKAETSEAVSAMLGSAWTALKIDAGTAFLQPQKEISLALIDFLNGIRNNMPELEALSGSLAELAVGGIAQLGEAMETSMPYIQSGLGFLAEYGSQVGTVLMGLTAAFAAMKLAPAVEGMFRGAGGLLLGSGTGRGKKSGLLGAAGNLFQKGQNAAASGGGFLSALYGASASNGFLSTLGAAASSLISGNGVKGTTGLLQTAAGTPGLLSGYTGVGSALAGVAANSRAGKYFSGIGTSLGKVGHTRIGTGMIGGTKAVGKTLLEVLANIAGPGGLGLTSAAGAAIGAAKSGAGWMAGKAGMLATAAAGSKVGQTAIRAAGVAGAGLGHVGKFAGASLGLLNSVTGIGSLMAGAMPIAGVLSVSIAAVSLLSDKLGGLQGILNSVRGVIVGQFGEEAGQAFDGVAAKITNAAEAVKGLFGENGVANALSGVRETLFGTLDKSDGSYTGGLFTGNTAAMLAGAFDGTVSIVQAVLDVLGNLTDFSVQTVKPMLVSVFQFIGGVVIPSVLQAFTNAAPIVAQIITTLGGVVMTGMQFIGAALEWVLPILATLVTAFLNVANAVIPILLNGFLTFSESVGVIVNSVMGVFNGLITFLTGVFTGNWAQAWEGVKQVFKNAFDGLAELFKVPINAVITLINTAISGINSLGLTIPEWVPLIGGNDFRINIPEFPMLARGGFTRGVSIAGEAGTEAVISFLPGVRGANINTWVKAGRMLGVDSAQAAQAAGGLRTVELKKLEAPDRGNPRHGSKAFAITYSPTIVIQGDADRDEIDRILREDKRRFDRWWEEKQRRERRVGFA